MLKDVTFGQYYPSSSFMHRCDPRSKIVVLIAYIVAIFLAPNFYGLAAGGIVLIAAILFSNVPVKSVFRSVKGILFLMLFTAVLNLFFYAGEHTVVIGGVPLRWGIINVTWEGATFMVFFACRLFMLVMASSVLTLTTTPVSLTDGMEALLTPLKWVKFPVHVLSLIMSIALRFIPTLMDETDRIMNAQKARGADFEHGNLIQRVKAIIPILIPLLISAFRRAEELGDAMEARCYSGEHERTKYKRLRFTWRDGVLFSVMLLLVVGIVLLRIFTVTLI